MALAFLLAVLGFVVLLIAMFIFPPARWVKLLEPKPDNKAKENNKES